MVEGSSGLNGLFLLARALQGDMIRCSVCTAAAVAKPSNVRRGEG